MRHAASLTINGGDQKISHKVYIHSSTSRDRYADTEYQAEGGTLSGGASTNGAGGIHVQSNSSVTLNDVTIAGCRAERRLFSDGYGGAICFEANKIDGFGYSSLTMNDSLIIGCYAYNDGGAIYYDSPGNQIVMKNSSIRENYAGADGGGIGYDYAQSELKGDGRSSISSNHVAGKGGTLWINQKGLSMSGLEIKGNAAERGGGLYVDKNGTWIADCEITGNSASISGGGL